MPVLYREWPWLRAEAEDASAAVVPAADRAALRDRIAEAVQRCAEEGNVRYQHIADAVLSVLPAPADRAAEELAAVRPQTLTALAAHVDARAVAILRPDSETYAEWQIVAGLLRRLAAVPVVGVAADTTPAETDRRETVEFLTQTQQPDDSWEFSSGATRVLEAAGSLLASLRRRMPEFEHRLAQRTTTVVVQPLADCPACEAGIEHDVHCPTPESHNAGCGCPTDQPGPVVPAQPGDDTKTREADPDCERCEGSGLDPDACIVNHKTKTWTHAPCSECLPEDDDTPEPATERVQHSGPDTKFCVLCLSGEHERVDEQPAIETQQPKEA
jgi:hypothetical protein